MTKGYEKKYDKYLNEKEEGVLLGYDYCIEDMENAIENIMDDMYDEKRTLDKIVIEEIADIVEQLKEWLRNEREEIRTAYIDNSEKEISEEELNE